MLCPLFFLPFLLTTGLNLLKLQTKSSVYSRRYAAFLVKNKVPLCGKFYGYPHHQNKLGHMSKHPNESCETSVFFGTNPSQGEKSKNSNMNKFLSSCFKFNQSFFHNSYSKLRNWLPCFYFATFQSTLQKSSDHFKDLHKQRLLTNFHDNPTSPVKVVPK